MNGSLAGRLALLSRQAGRRDAAAAGTPSHPAPPVPAVDRAGAGPEPRVASGAVANPAMPPGQVLAERLQRMAARPARPARLDDEALAGHLGGRVRAPGLVEVEHRHPLGQPHGSVRLDALPGADLEWLTGPRTGATPAEGVPAQRVFIDTETTGLAGGTGTLAFLVGIARVHGDALCVTQWLITRFSAEAALLQALLDALGLAGGAGASAVELVSYNGKSFDLPLLATRLRMARMGAPLGTLVHHDLLHPLRTAFGRQWPDCRLQTAERLLLGLERLDDLPGHRIPAVWADFVQFGESGELPALLMHNRIDLLSLAALLPALGRVYADPARLTVAAGPAPLAPDAVAIARMQRRRRRPDCARAHLLAARPALDAPALLELADLHRSRGDWTLAVPIWQELAASGLPAAAEALAKYHEHVSRDIAEALRWCEVLCRASPADPAHARRRHRLQERLQRRGALFG